mgnify:CR=1 FL=1
MNTPYNAVSQHRLKKFFTEKAKFKICLKKVLVALALWNFNIIVYLNIGNLITN